MFILRKFKCIQGPNLAIFEISLAYLKTKFGDFPITDLNKRI